MASNKINSKTKIKMTKAESEHIENDVDIDFSMLRKPITNNVTSFNKVRTIFDVATEEVSIYAYIFLTIY